MKSITLICALFLSACMGQASKQSIVWLNVENDVERCLFKLVDLEMPEFLNSRFIGSEPAVKALLIEDSGFKTIVIFSNNGDEISIHCNLMNNNSQIFYYAIGVGYKNISITRHSNEFEETDQNFFWNADYYEADYHEKDFDSSEFEVLECMKASPVDECLKK